MAACGIAAATAALATAAHAGAPSSASSSTTVPAPTTGVSRVFGADRYLTGVQVSQSQWADAGGDSTARAKAQAVVLTRGDTFPDALSGVPLAAKVHGPLLLTEPATLTSATAAEIQRVLGPGAGQPVYILGGTGAVSSAVEAQLTRDGYAVTRYSGANRYLTALDVARRGLGDPSRIVVATGDGYADALTAGPFAAGPDALNGAPAAIVLSNGHSLDAATAAYVSGKLAAAAPGDCGAVTTVGVQATVAVQSATRPGACSIPLAGLDRYATAETVAKQFPAGTSVGVATGGGFADALTGGAAMAALGRPLVLTDPKMLGDSPRLWLVAAHQAGVTSTVVFGGPGAVGDGVFAQLQDIANGGEGLPILPPPPPPPPPVTGLCGAPSNPYGFNYCAAGAEVTAAQVPLDICSYFTCIGTPPSNDSFWRGLGYLETCNDGDISLSGGRSGACSSHGGEDHPVWKR
jgi:putative cell wall-binding protein